MQCCMHLVGCRVEIPATHKCHLSMPLRQGDSAAVAPHPDQAEAWMLMVEFKSYAMLITDRAWLKKKHIYTWIHLEII